jgi:hypothetical protein
VEENESLLLSLSGTNSRTTDTITTPMDYTLWYGIPRSAGPSRQGVL